MIVFRNTLRITRLIRFGLHMIYGLLLAAWRFPKLDQANRVIYIQRWSNQLTHILGITLRVQGVAPGAYPPNHLLLSNHISWLDIFVLNAVTVSRFVAKSEIEHWPVVGKLCGYTGTLFIQREKKRDAARVNSAMVEALQGSHCVAVFPEGTTSDGSRILPFRSSLLQAALESRATIQPVYLRYTDGNGHQTQSAAYINDISILKSLWQILGQPQMHAEISFLAPFPADHADRRHLTQLVEARIVAAHKALNHGEGDFTTMVTKACAMQSDESAMHEDCSHHPMAT